MTDIKVFSFKISVFQYKYQINIDGTVAAYRFPFLLVSDAVIMKQDSVYYEHFYKDLQPYVHYVPFRTDLGNLLGRLNWLMTNDEQVYLRS